MSAIELVNTVLGGLRAVFDAKGEAARPTVIEEVYPPHHPLAGIVAAHRVYERGEDGAVTFARQTAVGTLADGRLHAAVAETRQAHAFGMLASLAEFLGERAGAAAFLEVAPDHSHATLRVLLDGLRPELGTVTCRFSPHATRAAWQSALGDGDLRDAGHATLADFLIDHQADLAEPALADVVARFRSAKRVEYDANLSDAGHLAFKATWGPEGREETGTQRFPRALEARFPIWSGAWDPGEEPLQRCLYSLRALPPKGEGAAPTFRVRWVDAAEVLARGVEELRLAVAGKLCDVPVYIGVPAVEHYVLPPTGTPAVGEARPKTRTK